MSGCCEYFSGTRRQTDGRTEGQADMMKLIFVFRNFANKLTNKNKKKTQTTSTKTMHIPRQGVKHSIGHILIVIY
jgi:hypothetical protein